MNMDQNIEDGYTFQCMPFIWSDESGDIKYAKKYIDTFITVQ